MTNGQAQVIYVTPPKPRRRRYAKQAGSILPILVIGGVAVYFLAKKFCWLPDYIECDTPTDTSQKTQSIVQLSSPSLHVESKNPIHNYLT